MSFPTFKSFKATKPSSNGIQIANRRNEDIGKKKRSLANEKKDLKALLESSDFRVDCRGDYDTLKYESLDKADIPKYKRFPGGLILGLGKHLRLVTRKNGKSEVVERFPKSNKREALSSRKANAQKDIILLENIRRIDRIIESYDKSFISLGLDWYEIESWDRQKGSSTQEFHSESQYLEHQRRFNELLAENPHDESLWCKFADFQMSRRGIGFKAFLEKQESVLQRAKNQLPASEIIAVRYLKCVSQFWENTRLLREWDLTISKFRNSFYIWDSYLAFRLSNFSTFSYSDVQGIFEHFSASVANSPDLQFQVFQRACEFHKSCGYYEKSVAMYQALIEFNFFCPKNLEMQPLQIKLQFFEDYWSSDCPKLGSESYLSWDKYYNNRKRFFKFTKREDDRRIELEEAQTSENVLECWIHGETHRELHDWFPQSSNEEVEDPDRIVIFEDIRSFIFQLPENHFPLLIRCMMSFFGVPMLEGSHFSNILGRGPGIPVHDEMIDSEKTNFFVQDFPITTQSPNLNSFKSLSNIFRRSYWGFSCSLFHGIGKDRLSFLTRFVNQISHRLNTNMQDLDLFSAISLCLSSSTDNQLLERNLKSALSQKESKILWGLYADIVRDRNINDVDTVRKIHFQILQQLDDFEILTSWLEWEISSDGTRDWVFCLNLLISFAHGLEEKSSPWSQISIVKARKFYEERSASLLIYFEFLYANSLSSFLDWKHNRTGTVNILSPEYLNCISLSFSRFPMEVSMAVAEIESLPDHPVVWALRLHHKRFMASTRYSFTSDSSLSPSQWLSRIWFEYLRHDDVNTSKHRIKRMFEQSVTDNPNTFILWDAYMRWICLVDPPNAKNVYIRAINSVPYSKDLYLSLIIGSIKNTTWKADIAEEKDLVEALNMMEEKEIRVRTLLEEIDVYTKK